MKGNSLLDEQPEPPRPEICLGLEFANGEARRAYFAEELRQKLQDPEFREIEGFPLGSDEDILALSDPPYHTACPNPWLADFVAEWQARKPPKPEGWRYHREPFAADVSEGKNDPVYNAHSYHTKVPHKAIMRYILHYTEPGDIVFDGFCGTGMTGVAAQMCGDRDAVAALGYQVRDDGTIWSQERDENGQPALRQISRLGPRRAILNDLSPAATFIAHNYNTPVKARQFAAEASRILAEVEKECGWMYQTWHTDEDTGQKREGRINYAVWSDVFVCPQCSGEVVFWNVAVDKAAGKVLDKFPCPHCGRELAKRDMDHAWETKYDRALAREIRQARQTPVLINYTVNIDGKNRRFEKEPDEFDLELIRKIENMDIPHWFPQNIIPEGEKTGEPIRVGITHVHHFYTKRNLWVIAGLKNKAIPNCWFWINAAQRYLSKMSKICMNYFFNGGGGAINAGLLGTLYLPSFAAENNPLVNLQIRLDKLLKVINALKDKMTNRPIISTGSSNVPLARANSIDYIFLDPPFGSNLNYSELNFLWEAWLRVFTDNRPEAIENAVQQKGPEEYRALMTACFAEAYRILKPGRWLTVEFSNTKASVWNSIQNSLADAGFIVANVSALDKRQGSFNSVTTPTAVKQDLIISAYKPNGGFEEQFLQDAETEEGAWDFVRSHLRYLPIARRAEGALQAVMERDPRILFDQMVAYHVRRGYMVPLSSQDFQSGLAERFDARDGLYFLPEQAAEYDRQKALAGGMKQAPLFVSDEASAIQWLRQLLRGKPQKFADINPLFMRQLKAWKKNEVQFDLRDLLEQNFLIYDGQGPVPGQILAYFAPSGMDIGDQACNDPRLQELARDLWYVPDPKSAADLEKLREKSLLKDFAEYKKEPRRLKVFRIEAVRAGFRKAWQENDYLAIVAVAAKLPHNILDEDPRLLMWRDQARTRLEAE